MSYIKRLLEEIGEPPMTFKITTAIETTYDELDIVREMLDTGEYGFGMSDITTEAILDFIGRLDFGSDVMYNNTTHKTFAKTITYRIYDENGGGDFFNRSFDGVSEHIRNSMTGTDPEALNKLINGYFEGE
jgi:hypothetical protein